MQLLINGIILVIFGLLAVYSTSIYESFTLSYGNSNFAEPTNYYYFYQQLKALIYIIVVIVFLRRFPIKSLKNHKFAGAIMIGAFIIQCLVFMPKIGISLNGSRGWLYIPGTGLPTVQPSEIFKLAYVIFLASWLTRKKDQIETHRFFLIFILLSALLYAIFLFVPDLGTILIIGATALIMVRYSGLSFKRTLLILGIGLFSGITFGLTFGKLIGSGYIYDRFSYFFTTNQEEIQDKRETSGWQITQALIAIGGGGFRGNGYGNGLQKYSNLPESYCDFIFAAFSEEIGFVGNLVLIALYVRMFVYFLIKLQKINDFQLKLIGVGIISLIVIQTFVNMGVNSGIIPNTGLTLPFISAGGSSLMINCVEILLLYKILKTENKVLPIK